MTCSLQAQAPVQVSPSLQFDAVHDTMIFELLEQNVLRKHQQLQQQVFLTPFPVIETEMTETRLSPDGKSMDMSFSRILPFDVSTVSHTAWTWGRAEFCSSHIGLVRLAVAATSDQCILIPHSRGASLSVGLQEYTRHCGGQARARDPPSERCRSDAEAPSGVQTFREREPLGGPVGRSLRLLFTIRFNATRHDAGGGLGDDAGAREFSVHEHCSVLRADDA